MNGTWPTLHVDRQELIRLMDACFGKDHYEMGEKPPLGASPEKFRSCDCSGFVRWLLYGCTREHAKMPAGSWNQHQWCRSKGFETAEYGKDAGTKDSRLRIAFIEPKPGAAGHVWLVVNGGTIESYGGHGPGRRRWDYPVLSRHVSECFVLTEPLV